MNKQAYKNQDNTSTLGWAPKMRLHEQTALKFTNEIEKIIPESVICYVLAK